MAVLVLIVACNFNCQLIKNKDITWLINMKADIEWT